MHAGHLIAYELELRERLKEINRAKREFADSHGGSVVRVPEVRCSSHVTSSLVEVMKIASTRLTRMWFPLNR